MSEKHDALLFSTNFVVRVLPAGLLSYSLWLRSVKIRSISIVLNPRRQERQTHFLILWSCEFINDFSVNNLMAELGDDELEKISKRDEDRKEIKS